MKKSVMDCTTNFTSYDNDILYKSVMDNGHKFNAAVILEELTGTVLVLGTQSIWSLWLPEDLLPAIKRSYCWKGMKKHILVHYRNLCYMCKTKSSKKHNLKNKYLNQACNQWSYLH